MPNSLTGRTKQDAAAKLAATLNRAITAHQNNQLDQAEALYRSMLDIDDRQFDALHMLGVLQAQRGRFEDGRALIARALEASPRSSEAHCNLGRVLRELGRREQAVASFETALAINPQLIVALSNRGVLLRELGRPDEALASSDQALALAPNNLDIMFNRGNVLIDLRRFAEALDVFDAVLKRQPGYVDARIGRANALEEMGRQDEALEAYNEVIAAQPNRALAYRNRGSLMMQRGLFRNAAADFATALQIDGACDYALGSFVYCRMSTCDWAGIDQARASLGEDVRAGKKATTPLVMLSADPSPADQLTCARTFVADKYAAVALPPVRRARPHDKIRLAYVSADLRDHAVAFLTAGLFERHDRARFETTAISLSPAQPGAMRDRLTAAFDRFIQVDDKSDAEIAALMRELEIDIAVDLMGYTRHARAGILARRPAPIQVNYLGYAGTMGADFIDYIVADRFVVPEGAEQYYSEKVVTLPDSYFVNDSARAISARQWSRSEADLPEQGVVFCAFNAFHKLTPQIFSVWMRLLTQVDGSVLWLSEGSEAARTNLCREAEVLGIAPSRLIFAPRLIDNADHLARCRLADLFLDTPHYNAHATAADALWAGVPIVTWAGETFAGRVAGSLLNAVGLSELITHSLAEYETLALKLGRDPDLLAQTRAKLARHRSTHPLFDTARFTRHLEAAYVGMWERCQRGEAPANFAVDAIG
jgi:protein O-GlcNAc transferase